MSQLNLFSRFADPPRSRQPGLYDGRPVEAEERCRECGRRLIETASGEYLVCPAGHGRLIVDSKQ